MMTTSTERRRAVWDPWHIGFGAVALVAALLALVFWFPNDIKGGFVDKGVTDAAEPGDAFFPFILGALLLVLSAIQLFGAVFRPADPIIVDGVEIPTGHLTLENLKFLLKFYVVIGIGMLIMYWLGPLVVDAMRGLGVLDATYRQLVDTAPYKYIGYVVGGFLMTMTLIALTEGQVRRNAVVTVIIVIALLIFVLNGLLHNIQLPPNADF